MIGVWVRDSERAAVEEFFQLFKTPWEFWRPEASYEVVVATGDGVSAENSACGMVMCSSETVELDAAWGVKLESRLKGAWVEGADGKFPLYGKVATFMPCGERFLCEREGGRVIGLRLGTSRPQSVRFGFDIFYETAFLLRHGQPRQNAACPTLDRLIAVVRTVLLQMGVRLVEILPVPPGYRFMACLTHDVDFVGIRDHKFDHTMWGFLYRASIGSLVGFIRGRTSWAKCRRNWAAVLSLPLVVLGVKEDLWLEFDRYCEIEGEGSSTFFFIPFRGIAGASTTGVAPSRRAAKYDVLRIRNDVRKLAARGCEVGVHGIDSWCDVRRARVELERIQTVSGQPCYGSRMHWLYWAEKSAAVLQQAGIAYDSTCGYNDAVGFRAGTTQVFCPLGVEHLLELPLHIQDSALFYPDRMKLSETDALDTCRALIRCAVSTGGVLTLNWHTRSLSPERLWGEFYIALLNELRTHKVWFGTARQIVDWFRKRRELKFSSVQCDEAGVTLSLRNPSGDATTSVVVRAYDPRRCGTYTDAEWRGEKRLSISYAD